MRVPHGWECTTHRCGTYNAMHYAECRVCGAPRDSGRVLYTVAPDPPQPPPRAPFTDMPPARPIWEGIQGAQWWRVACIFLIVTFVPWYFILIGAFFGLLIWIGVGIWRLVERKP